MIELVESEINGYMCPTDPGEPGHNAPRLSVNDAEARLLSELCAGRVVLEIGTGLGVSTRAIAKTAKLVATVDCDPWVRDNVVPTLPDNCVSLWSAMQMQLRPDMAFIDGSHKYPDVLSDIATCMRLVKPGGMLIIHDLYIDHVQAAIMDSKLPFIHIQTSAGIALAWNNEV